VPASISEDKVWFDEARKLAQLCADISAAQSSGRSVLLLSHFDATVALLATSLRERSITFSSTMPAEPCGSPAGTVWLGLARAFQVESQLTSPQIPGAGLDIMVAEHHPMRSRDQAIIDAAGKLSCAAQVSFYFSLDDPLMKYFGAESIKGLFERLGIDKSECISHQLINTAVRKAQEKIERKVGKDLPAHTAEDWFRYNLRQD